MLQTDVVLSLIVVKKEKIRQIEIENAHINDIANYKTRIKKLELVKQKLEQDLIATEQALKKSSKEKENVMKEMLIIQRQNMHLANSIGEPKFQNYPNLEQLQTQNEGNDVQQSLIKDAKIKIEYKAYVQDKS